MKRALFPLVAFCFLVTPAIPQTVTREVATYPVKMIKPKVASDMLYEDPFIKIQFVGLQKILFKLSNKTNNPIEIDWAKVSFVDSGSGAHRVIHQGVRYIERDKVPAPTVIPPQASITDLILPSDYITYDSSASEGWKVEDPIKHEESEVGKTFGIFLPLKINGVVKNYSFRFVIEKETKQIKIPAMALTKEDLNSRKITKDDLKTNWPFTFDEAELACGKGYIFITHTGKTYIVSYSGQPITIDGVPVEGNIDGIMNEQAKAGKLNFGAVTLQGRLLCK